MLVTKEVKNEILLNRLQESLGEAAEKLYLGDSL